MRAATFAYSSTAFPMLTGTMVTLAGFMPVGFARSIAGEYAGGIFWVVGVALIASWFVAVVFTPYLGVLLLPSRMKAHGGDPYARPIYLRLRGAVRWCVNHRNTVLAATALLFGAAVAGMGLVQQQFFPTASRLELIVDLRLREGASFVATEAQVRRLEQMLQRDPQVEHFTAYTGAGAPRFFLSLSAELPNPGYAQIIVQTASMADREAVRNRLLALFAEDAEFPDLRGRVTRFEFGPPVGFPVQFRVIGPDTAEVRQIAYRVRDIVRQSPLVRDTQLDWNEQVRTMRVEVDQDKARLLGLSTREVSEMVHTVLSGAPVTQIRRGEDLVDVVLRAKPDERLALERLSDINLFGRDGSVVPLAQVATLHPAFEEPVLWRRNRDMALTVRADAVDGVQAPTATTKIWPSLQPVIESLPPGYRIEQGGAIEESDKSNRALFAVFPLMFVVMLFFLMLQLQSFSRMFMVFLTAPLGLIGVVPALLVFNAPFGFVALLGVIALGGMIMRNAVILVDQIDQDIAGGSAPWVAVVEATVRRARPVLLTAAAAILAMVPLEPQRVLGADGDRHHGRAGGGHGADAGLRAGAVCGVVRGARKAGCRRAASRRAGAGGLDMSTTNLPNGETRGALPEGSTACRPLLIFVLTLLGAMASLVAQAALAEDRTDTPMHFTNPYVVEADRGERVARHVLLPSRLGADHARPVGHRGAAIVPLNIEAMARRPFAVAWLGHAAMLVRAGSKWMLLDPALSGTAGPVQGFGPDAADAVADRAGAAAAHRPGADLARPLRPPRPGHDAPPGAPGRRAAPRFRRPAVGRMVRRQRGIAGG